MHRAINEQMAPVIADSKLCEYCLTVKPITEFRRRYRDGTERMNECRTCHNESERMRRAHRRTSRDNDAIKQFVTRLKNTHRPEQIELLCGAMIRRLGGLQSLFVAWVRQVEAAQSAQPGSKKVLDFYQAIFRMIEYCNSGRRDLAEISDEDLQGEIMESCKQLIRQHPEVAVEAAEQIGWTVIPDSAA